MIDDRRGEHRDFVFTRAEGFRSSRPDGRPSIATAAPVGALVIPTS
jgi:hypothetical protein